KYKRAAPSDPYPRAVFFVDPLQNDGITKGVLTVRLWDKTESSVQIDAICSAIIKKLSGASEVNDDFFIFLHEGKAQNEDTEQLQGYRITFDYEFLDKELTP
ncbi:MAG: hypothetical protein ACK5L3_09065, partial [Oscillospiraceae bacterium]